MHRLDALEEGLERALEESRAELAIYLAGADPFVGPGGVRAAGGGGLAATEVGAAVGARVIGAVSSEEKEDAVRDAGADDVVRYDRTPLRDALRQLAPGGVDVVFDPVGGDATAAARTPAGVTRK